MPDNRTTYTHLRDLLSGTAMVLHAADAADLPGPFDIAGINRHSDPVKLMFDTASEYDAWVTWVGALIQPDTTSSGYVHHSAQGEMFELPLTLLYLEPITCRCGHPVASHREVGCGAYAGHGRGCTCMRTPDSVLHAHASGASLAVTQ